MNENKYRDSFKEEISFDNFTTYHNDIILNCQTIVNRTLGLKNI